jgi:hypothetical protein
MHLDAEIERFVRRWWQKYEAEDATSLGFILERSAWPS